MEKKIYQKPQVKYLVVDEELMGQISGFLDDQTDPIITEDPTPGNGDDQAAKHFNVWDE
jgi:hypothetical protein